MKTMLMVVGLCIVVFAVVWAAVTLVDMQEETKLSVQHKTIEPPQTVVITDYASQVETLQAQITTLKAQLAHASIVKPCPQPVVTPVYYRTEDYYYDRNYNERNNNNDNLDLLVTVENDNGDPIENAEVRLTDGITRTHDTDEDGETEFTNLDEDCYNIRVKKSGFDTEEREICIEDDRTVTFRLS
jgi:hypothetical protein